MKKLAKYIIVITTVSAAVMELVDTSIVNVALTDMAGSLGVSIEDISWVITSYAIANVIIIPLTSFLAEYFGRKNYYIASMIIFTIASYMCGNSTSLVEIVLWRFVQGVGGGALLSTSQSILFDAFSEKDRPIAAGLFGMGLVLGPTFGPTIGGYIIEHYSWPLIFMINVPIGFLATILAYIFVEKKEKEGEHKKGMYIDYTGILFLAAGIGCLQYVLERGESEDWFSSNIIRICSVVAATGLTGFIIRELRIKNPAVNLRVMGNRNLVFTTIFTCVVGFGLFTSVFVYPVLAQRVLGFSAYETGLSLLAPSCIAIILMPVIGKSMSKGTPAIPFLITGFILFALYTILTSRVSPDVGIWNFFLPLLLRSAGLSMVMLPLINQAVVGLKPQEYSSGIALNNMIRQLGGAFGIAIANNYIAKHYTEHRMNLVSNLTQGSAVLNDHQTAIQHNLIRTGIDSATAVHSALGILSAQVDRQAYYLSYLDTFRLIALFFIIVIPFVIFLRAKKKTPGNNAAMLEAH
ncbi:MAG: DHA2 family efflux MFS transporter permease subunit [Parafilimonas sp.]|nr:DHA2 family efflux MFS transporter permease subunit [Parafilimonas sp.]